MYNIQIQQIWTVFNYISHTCERSAIEKDDRGNIQEILLRENIYTSRHVHKAMLGQLCILIPS